MANTKCAVIPSCVTPWAPGTYTLMNARSGLVMDLSGDDVRSVIGFPPHGGINQQWEFITSGQGCMIRCARPSLQGLPLYLTIEGSQLCNAAIVATTYPVSWKVEQKGASISISWPNSDLVLDIAGGSSVARTPIRLAVLKSGEGSQLWNYTPV